MALPWLRHALAARSPSDGERWRWCLAREGEGDASRKADAEWRFANFLMRQFDVQTMRQWGITLPGAGEGNGSDVNESGPFALPGLGEDETIARLATGIKRFKLPDEFNWIAILKRLVDGPNKRFVSYLAVGRDADPWVAQFVYELFASTPAAGRYCAGLTLRRSSTASKVSFAVGASRLSPEAA